MGGVEGASREHETGAARTGEVDPRFERWATWAWWLLVVGMAVAAVAVAGHGLDAAATSVCT